jgi:hypothetical protein
VVLSAEKVPNVVGARSVVNWWTTGGEQVLCNSEQSANAHNPVGRVSVRVYISNMSIAQTTCLQILQSRAPLEHGPIGGVNIVDDCEEFGLPVDTSEADRSHRVYTPACCWIAHLPVMGDPSYRTRTRSLFTPGRYLATLENYKEAYHILSGVGTIIFDFSIHCASVKLELEDEKALAIGLHRKINIEFTLRPQHLNKRKRLDELRKVVEKEQQAEKMAQMLNAGRKTESATRSTSDARIDCIQKSILDHTLPNDFVTEDQLSRWNFGDGEFAEMAVSSSYHRPRIEINWTDKMLSFTDEGFGGDPRFLLRYYFPLDVFGHLERLGRIGYISRPKPAPVKRTASHADDGHFEPRGLPPLHPSIVKRKHAIVSVC